MLLVVSVLHVGEISWRGEIISTLVLPPMNRKCGFNVPILRGSFLCILVRVNFMATFTPGEIHSGSGLVIPPLYMYIYSLRAFLTTKGALIDGDWGGSKTDPKI